MELDHHLHPWPLEEAEREGEEGEEEEKGEEGEEGEEEEEGEEGEYVVGQLLTPSLFHTLTYI